MGSDEEQLGQGQEVKARDRLNPQFENPGTFGVKWLTTGQVAKQLGVSSKTVSKWIDEGKLPGIRVPYSLDRRVHPSALEQFAKDHGYYKASGRGREI